jgi:hypothetical protein
MEHRAKVSQGRPELLALEARQVELQGGRLGGSLNHLFLANPSDQRVIATRKWPAYS